MKKLLTKYSFFIFTEFVENIHFIILEFQIKE